jgi:hypothetical protein
MRRMNFGAAIPRIIIDRQRRQLTNSMEDGVYVSLSHDPLNPTKIMDLVRSPEAGAIVLFSGTTRNNFAGINHPKCR